MNTNILKRISAVCLILAVSAAAWACGGNGGSCGDKNKKDAAVFTTQCDGDKKADADKTGCCNKKSDDKGGCKDAGSGSKECPK